METQGHVHAHSVPDKRLERTRVSVAVRVDLLARIEAHTVQYGGTRQDVVETALLHFFEPRQEQLSLDILSAKLDALMDILRVMDGVVGQVPPEVVVPPLAPPAGEEKPGPWYGSLVETPGEPPETAVPLRRGWMTRWMFGPAE